MYNISSSIAFFVYNYLYFNYFYLRNGRYTFLIDFRKTRIHCVLEFKNRKGINHMWMKLFRKRRLQITMIFIIILLCTALLNGAALMLTSINEPFLKLERETKPASLRLYLYDTDKAVLQTIKNNFESLDQVNRVEVVNYYYADDNLYHNEKKIDVFADLVEYQSSVNDSIRMITGTKETLKNLGDNECIVPVCIMNEAGLKRFDTLTVRHPDFSVKYRIVGSYVEPYSTSTAFDSEIIVKHIPTQYRHETMLKVYAKDSVNSEAILQAYRTRYPGIFPGILTNIEEVKSNSMLAVNIVAAAFLAIGFIMLIVSGLIINFTIQHFLKTDEKTIAIYKTIGYTANDILKMYERFFLLIVSVSSILGVYFSKYIAMLALTQIYKNLGETVSIHVLQTGIVCVIVITGFILSLVYLVMRRIKNIKPMEALNGSIGVNTKKQEHSLNGSVSFSPYTMAKRSIMRDKKGTLGILIIAIVTVIMVNFAMISLDVASSQKKNNHYWIGVDPSHVVINVNEKDKYDFVESIVKKDPRIHHYFNASLNQRIYLNFNKDNSEATISAFVYENYNDVNLPVIKGHNPTNDKEIAIGSVVANKLHLQLGDYMECYIGNGTKVNLLVSGIFQTYYNLGLVSRLCSATYTKNNEPVAYNYCAIYLNNPKEQAQVLTDLKKEIGNNGNVIKRTDAYAAILNMIVNPQLKGIPPVTVLVFMIAAINIFSITLLRNVRNEKTFCIYKCIGFTTKDLIRSNLCYVGFVACIAIVVGLPIIILSYGGIMKVSLRVFGFQSYPYTVNTLHIFLINLAVVIVFVFSSLLSSRALYHVNVKELIIE